MLTLNNEKLNNAGYYLINNHNFWSEIFLSCNIHNSSVIPTAGVNFTEKGMNLVYNNDFIDELSQAEVNFVIMHEVYHLISNHQTRAAHKGYDHHLANIAMDMIINSDIKERYVKNNVFISIPKNTEGIENCYFLPEEYDGEKIMEAVYEWLKENPDKFPQPQEEEIDFSNMTPEEIAEALDGKSIDVHLEDTVPADMKDSIIKDITERIKQRGLMTSDVEDIVHRLRPPSKNYLKDIKTSIEVLGNSSKNNTWQRPGRRHEFSRGFRRKKLAFNVILDVSGSMHGSFEKALSYIFKNGYEINLYQVDTEVKCTNKIKTKGQLQKMKIRGCGGTTLQPAIDKIVKEHNGLSTIVLTDGYTDTLDITNLRHKVLILSVDTKCPIYNDGAGNKIKQIVIER